MPSSATIGEPSSTMLPGPRDALYRQSAHVKEFYAPACTETTKSESKLPFIWGHRKKGGLVCGVTVRSQLRRQDSDILKDIECIFLNDLLQTFPNVTVIRLAITGGFPWYTDQLMEKVKQMETPQIIASIVQELDPRVLKYFADEQNLNIKLLNKTVEHGTVDEALNRFDWPSLFVTIKGVRHRAQYYQQELGFDNNRDGTTSHVVYTTRQNIESRCKNG